MARYVVVWCRKSTLAGLAGVLDPAAHSAVCECLGFGHVLIAASDRASYKKGRSVRLGQRCEKKVHYRADPSGGGFWHNSVCASCWGYGLRMLSAAEAAAFALGGAWPETTPPAVDDRRWLDGVEEAEKPANADRLSTPVVGKGASARSEYQRKYNPDPQPSGHPDKGNARRWKSAVLKRKGRR